jgi:hypothetical protein
MGDIWKFWFCIKRSDRTKKRLFIAAAYSTECTRMSPLTLMGVFVELLLVNLQKFLAIRHHFPGGIDLSTKELCNFIKY